MKAPDTSRRLGDLFAFKNGRAFKKEEWGTAGLPIIRIQNLNNLDGSFNYYAGEYSDEILVQDGDLLFSWSGTVGSSFGPHIWQRGKGLLNQHIFRVAFKTEMDSKYAYYALEEITEEIEQQVSGAVGLVHITKEKLNEFTIPVPPLAEQRRIVGILDEAFEAIATAKANAEQNHQNARALFESHLNAVFTQRGDGWVEKTLDEVCVIGDGNHSSNYPRKEELVEAGIPFIRATNLIEGRISGDDMRFLSPEKHAQLKKGHLRTGDVLLTNRGEIGKIALVDEAYDNANLNSQIAWLRCRQELDHKFLFHALNSPVIQLHFQSGKNGAALQQFTIRQIKLLTVPVPPKSSQRSIVTNLDAIDDETQRLESIYQRKLAALDELKKSLLHQAFSGEL